MALYSKDRLLGVSGCQFALYSGGSPPVSTGEAGDHPSTLQRECLWAETEQNCGNLPMVSIESTSVKIPKVLMN